MKQISTYSRMNAHLLTHTHISRITLYAAFLFIGLLCSVGNAWGATVTYTVTSTSTVSSSGDAITGASVTYSQTYTNASKQITKDNSATLTITSMGGISISNFTLSMKSNAKSGGGKLKYSTDGGTTYTYLVGSDSEGVAFNQPSWHGSYSDSYDNISKDVSLSNVTRLIIMIESTTSSLYCQSYSITYTAGSGKICAYDANGGTGTMSDSNSPYSSGATVTVLSNSFTRVGYTFDHWDTKADDSGIDYAPGDQFTISASTTLYAQWRNTYAGSEFNLVENLSDLGDGSKIILLGLNSSNYYAMTRTQGGNYREGVASGVSEFTMSNSNKTVTLGASTSVQVITLEATNTTNIYELNVENGYLYAAASSNNYMRTQTTHNTNDTKFTIGLSEGIFSLIAASSSNRNHMRFNYNSNNPLIFSCYASSSGLPTPIIYVMDEGTKYDISWANGGHGTAPTSPTSASKVTLPEISATGYTHTGWKANVAVTNTSTSSSISAGTLIANGTRVLLGAATTFTAQWSPISYSVRFNSNDENYLGTAEGSMSNESYDYGESKALTTNAFSLAGYDFAGWATTPTGDVAYTDGASASNLSSTDGATVDLYAIWTAKKYNVTLAATNETSSVGSQTVQATYNAAMPLVTTADGTPAVAAPSRTGYTFTGWEYSSTTYYNYNAGTSTLSSAHVWDQPNSTTTLTPKWSINSYLLTWDLAGGTVATAGTGASEGATGTPSSSVEYNAAITVPTVTRAGYNFAGWDVTPASNMPASNVTYTATWTAKTLNSISLAETEVEIYDQQYVLIDVIYDPADILTKGYTLVSSPTKVVTTGSTNAQLKLSATKAGVVISETVSETISIQAKADGTKTTSVTVTINPLPRVHFVDNIHNETFADVVATISENALVATKTTPTHADVAEPGSGNACEKSHLHLVGWIDKDWADEHPNATHSEILGASTGVYYSANTDIDLSAKNGKTFLAVWSKIE